MAGAIVPILTSLIPELVDKLPDLITFITGLVHQESPKVEVANGPKTGPKKFADVMQAVMTALQNAAAVGTIPKTLPPDDLIKVIIQTVISSMQIGGLLTDGGSTTGTVSPVVITGTDKVFIKPGQSVTISVA